MTRARTSALSRNAETCDHKNVLMATMMQTDLKKGHGKSPQSTGRRDNNSSKSSVLAAKENVATRKFSSLMNLLCQTRCTHVDKLSCGVNANYMSDQAAEGFHEACAKVITNEIEKEIQQSTFFKCTC